MNNESPNDDNNDAGEMDLCKEDALAGGPQSGRIKQKVM